MGRLIVMMLPLLGVSCAGEGPVATDASYNLTCPDLPASCSLPQGNCLGNGGLREILGVNGEVSCDGETPLIAICELQRFEGGQLLTLVASVGDEFAFELRGVAVESDGSVSGAACAVTIIEDQVSYGGRLGACGDAQPSVAQTVALRGTTRCGQVRTCQVVRRVGRDRPLACTGNPEERQHHNDQTAHLSSKPHTISVAKP